MLFHPCHRDASLEGRRLSLRVTALLLGAGTLVGCSDGSPTAHPDSPDFSGSDAGSVVNTGGLGGTAGVAGAVGLGGAGGSGGGGGASGAGGSDHAGSGGVSNEGTCLAATEACADGSQCCEGLSCGSTTLGQVCCGNQGAPCNTSNGEDCCNDLLCVQGQCGYPTLTNDTCQPSCLPLEWMTHALRAAGLTVIEEPGWLAAGHGYFNGLWGVMAHHTGNGSDTAWMTVRDGRSDLPGPLAQLVLEKDGTYRVIAAGVAWHAGAGSYLGLPTNNANFYTIGIEAVNTGTEGFSYAQYSAYVLGCAALIKHLGLDASRVIGHKEWAGASQGKWDPGGIDMDAFRSDVQSVIDLE